MLSIGHLEVAQFRSGNSGTTANGRAGRGSTLITRDAETEFYEDAVVSALKTLVFSFVLGSTMGTVFFF